MNDPAQTFISCQAAFVWFQAAYVRAAVSICKHGHELLAVVRVAPRSFDDRAFPSFVDGHELRHAGYLQIILVERTVGRDCSIVCNFHAREVEGVCWGDVVGIDSASKCRPLQLVLNSHLR